MRRGIIVIAGLLVGISGEALAAEQQASAGDAGSQAETTKGGEDDIVVTARRRVERAQDVPIALTALADDQVAVPGSVGLSQVAQMAPSLQLTTTNARQTNINIRGLGATPAFASLGLEYGVGVYVDQVYFSRPTQAAFDLYDLERIEVLRGPQGTLFGKNTTAGAINVTTRAPSFDPEFRGELSGGNYQSFQVRAMGSAPINDKVAVRVSVTDTIRNQGYFRNVRDGSRLNDMHNWGVREQLLFKPSDAVSLRLIADFSHLKQNCCIGTLTSVLTTRVDGTPLPANFYQRAARFGYQPLPIDPFARKLDLNRPTNLEAKTSGVTAIADFDLGPATLTSVTGWRTLSYRPNIDGDTIGLDIFTNAGVNENQRQFSQELRLASNGQRTLDYVLGLYYFSQRIDDHFFTYYGSDAALWILGPAPNSTGPSIGGQAALNGLKVDGFARANTKSYAAFGQATWHITPALGLTAGLRYTHERKAGFFEQWQSGPALTAQQVLFGAQAIRNAFGPTVPRFNVGTRENRLSGLATLTYKITPDVMIYATYARGFKSGGLNLNPTSAPKVIAPERVENYEAGVKSSLFDRLVTLNLAAFRTTIRNYQSQQIDTSVATTAYIANVGTVRSQGLEADLSLRLSPHARLFAAASYIDAIYVNYRNAPCPVEYLGLKSICDLSGRNLPGVSKYSFSFGGDFAHPISDRAELYLAGEYSHRSTYNASYNLAANTRVAPFGVANLRFGARASDERWDIGVFVRNLFDEKYIPNIGAGAFNTGQYSGSAGEPRTYGLVLRTRL